MAYWHTGLFDCLDDCGSCCDTLFCPCGQFGDIQERIGEGDCCCCGLCCLIFSPFYCCSLWIQRTTVRSKYGLAGNCCCDGFISLVFPLCSLCQMARELKLMNAISRNHGRYFFMTDGYGNYAAGVTGSY